MDLYEVKGSCQELGLTTAATISQPSVALSQLSALVGMPVTSRLLMCVIATPVTESPLFSRTRRNSARPKWRWLIAVSEIFLHSTQPIPGAELSAKQKPLQPSNVIPQAMTIVDHYEALPATFEYPCDVAHGVRSVCAVMQHALRKDEVKAFRGRRHILCVGAHDVD